MRGRGANEKDGREGNCLPIISTPGVCHTTNGANEAQTFQYMSFSASATATILASQITVEHPNNSQNSGVELGRCSE